MANEARNRRRSAGRRAALALRVALPIEADRSAEAAVIAGESRTALLEAISRLRDDDRLVLGCRYLLELTEAETAAALGVKQGTVKSRTSRALGRLRGEVERDRPRTGPALARRRLARDARPRAASVATRIAAEPRSRGGGASPAAGAAAPRTRSPRSRCCSAARWPSPPRRARTCCAGSASRASRSSARCRGRTPGASLRLGTPTTVEALRAAGVPVLVPKDLGEPDAYKTTLPDGTVAASLVYPGPVLVQTFKAGVDRFIEKSVATADAVEDVRVNGKRGYFITGAHGFAYETGTDVNYEDQRIAGNTLLLEGDGQLLRIEGDITRDRALELARST